MRAVAAVTARVVGASSPEDARRVLEEVAREVIPLDTFHLLRYDAEQGALSPFGTPEPDTTEDAVGDGFWDRLVTDRRPFCGPAGAGSAVWAPVEVGDDLVGVLAVRSDTPGRYRAEDVEVVDTLASLAAAVLSIHRLAEERGAAEQARSLSESRFRTVFDQLPLSMQVFSPEGRTLGVNRAWQDLFRLPLEVLDNFNPLRDPQLQEVRSYLERGFSGETITVPPHPFDPGVLQGGGGRTRWLEVTASPVHADDGTVHEVIVLHRDVTSQVEAEAALHRAHQDLERRIEERTAELAQAEARFRAIVEASPVPLILSHARDGTILFANGRLESLIGTEPGSLVGQKTPDFYYDPADRPAILAMVREQGYVRGAELRIRRLDGTPRWVSLSVQQLDFNGEPALATALVDVTERKEAEEALRGRTEELEAVFRALPDLYFRMEADGTIRDYRAGRQFGLYAPPEEFLGRRVQDVLPPPVGARVGEALGKVARTTDLVQVEYDLPLDQTQLSFEARLLPLTGGEVVAVVRDVTERSQAEAALRESEVSFRGLFNSLTELVYVQDLEGRFFNVNEAVVRAYGYTREELIGRTPDILAAPGTYDEEAFAEMFARAAVGETQRFEWWGRRKDGTTFPKEVVLQRSTYFGQVVVLAVARDMTAQKEAEAALRASEEHFRRLIENSTDIITILDDQGRVRYQSPAVQRVLGYELGELSGENVFAYIHPDDVATTRARLLRVSHEPGRSETAQYRFRHKDGSWRVLEGRGSTLSPDSADEGVVVNSRDVTERVEAEAALRASEEHFRRLTENASDMIQVIDVDTRIVYTGSSVERLLGYTPEEIKGTSAMDYLHPDDVPQALAAVGALVGAPGTPMTVQYRVRRKDGAWRTFEARCRTLSATSAAEGFIVNARDVTERVEVERALQFQKTLLEAEGEASIDGILVISPEGQVLSYNARFVEMWGIPSDVVGARSDEAALQAVVDQLADPEAFLARVEHLYAHPDEVARDEVPLRDGRVFDRYSAPVRSPEGDYYGRIWFFRDVTAERQRARDLEVARGDAERAYRRADAYAQSLERSLAELRDAQERLVHQEKMAGLGRLTAGIAHELKNPLNFVTNFSLMNVELVGDIRHALDHDDHALLVELLGDVEFNARRVHEHGQRADGIVQRMMEHARAGSETPERRPVDLNALVEAEVIHALEDRLRLGSARVVSVDRDFDDRIGEVPAVSGDLGRVVGALIANAMDAVEARAAREGDAHFIPHVTVRTRREGQAVTVAIVDNGEGVPEGLHGRLFEPFFTTRPVGSRHLGLGLSLAHETVTAGYGGWITVESAEGQGSTFTVTLPAP